MVVVVVLFSASCLCVFQGICEVGFGKPVPIEKVRVVTIQRGQTVTIPARVGSGSPGDEGYGILVYLLMYALVFAAACALF